MNVVEAVQALRARGEVLVGLDFDGTLAPLVAHPDQAVPDAAALELVGDLSVEDGIRVVIVSGRSLDDLRLRLGKEIPGVVLIGEHGNDRGAGVPDHEMIDEAARLLEVLAGGRDATIEHKAQSVTFHTRNLDEVETAEAISHVRAWAAEHPEVTLLEGKEVLELTVATGTKGDVIQDLVAPGEGILYIGDDQTDETVFAALGPDDVGVKVGSGATAARYRVKNVAEVVELLEAFALASS